MLTTESLQQAMDILVRVTRTNSPHTNTEWEFLQDQLKKSYELIALSGMKACHGINLYEGQTLEIALFLINTQRVKDWLTRLNNKAFW